MAYGPFNGLSVSVSVWCDAGHSGAWCLVHGVRTPMHSIFKSMRKQLERFLNRLTFRLQVLSRRVYYNMRQQQQQKQQRRQLHHFIVVVVVVCGVCSLLSF